MTTQANKALVRRYIERINQGDLNALDEYFSPNLVEHVLGNRSPTPSSGLEALRRMINWRHSAFPDAQWIVEDLIAEGDRVVVRQTFLGTRQASLVGTAPASRQVAVPSIDVFRIADDRIVESWRSGALPRMPIGPPCNFDTDCPPGTSCWDGFCIPNTDF
jgi:predicted ester cyclase